MLADGLKMVPKLDVAVVNAALSGGPKLELKSKQANLVVAWVNRTLKSEGLSPITAKELLGPGTKPTPGCLDPCEGVSTDRLLGLIQQHLGGASA